MRHLALLALAILVASASVADAKGGGRVVGRAGPVVTTGPWNVSGATFVRVQSVSAQATNPNGIFFKSDGTKMFIASSSPTAGIFEYALSTAWNISTATFTTSVATATAPTGLTFQDDGTRFFYTTSTGDLVVEYNMSGAWDLTTAAVGDSFGVGAQETLPTDVTFGDSGTKMYVSGNAGQDVNQYALSGAWDITTASFTQNFSVAAQAATPLGLFLKSDGTKMYVATSTGSTVRQWNLGTAWNITTSVYNQQKSVSAQDTAPEGVYLRSDGLKMYIVGTSGDEVDEYDIAP